ncbi:hypothetical protein HMPREF1248_1292 [Coriobacteriaceae bacterium BV3Ac1]|uniref:hypothetical protein n=1 Tax=Olegusella massiliensis TaxID=1776381 RepID=UPI0003AD8F0B|nr:hypothetical protein [Olegusella massiliensis]ERL12909.1 hypothetical protein HMPREF1248_1292 [Coriobacteriaceae bacterium BV3Ac1]
MLREKSQCIHKIDMGGGEYRELGYTQSEDGIEIYETSWGPDTQALFGDPSHTQKLILKRSSLKVCTEFEEQNFLTSFLFAGELGDIEWLSEVQDRLDRAELPYVYMAFAHDGQLYRPFCEA